jgi:hypothetical protein
MNNNTPGPENLEPDTINDITAAETPPTSPNPNKAKLLKVVVCIVALGLIGSLGYLYTDKSRRNNDLAVENAQLAESIAASASAEVEIETTVDALAEVEVAESCSEGSSYAASVGKFTVSLDSPYVVIRNLDEAYEGGPITNLNIATCLPDESNVYDSFPSSKVSILAHPASTSSQLRTSYESSSGSLTADGTVTIAGLTADKYALSALLETTLYYFDNAGIGYQIELSDTNTVTNAILADLLADWVFTP